MRHAVTSDSQRDVGFLLMGAALIGYALLLKRLLQIVRKPAVWSLLIIGGGLLLSVVNWLYYRWME